MKARTKYPGFYGGLKWYPEDIVGFPYNTKGDYWFVDADKSTGGSGTSWEDAFATFGAAVTALSDDDVIFVGPGTYNEGVTHTITEDNVKIIGTGDPAVASESTLASYVSNDDKGDEDILELQGNNIEVANILFQVGGNAEYWGIKCGADQEPSSIWIHDCFFYDGSTGAGGGVQAGRRDGDEGNAINWLIENNTFHQLKTGINLDGSRSQVYNNNFLITNQRTGILNPQTGAQRNANYIVGNRFTAIGTPNTGVGINFSGAVVPTVGSMIVDRNTFINFSSATNAVNRLATYGGFNMLGDQFLTDANPPVATTIS